jgi:hypothetical protein
MRWCAEALGCSAPTHGCGELFHDPPQSRASKRHPARTALPAGARALSNQPLSAEERAQIEGRIHVLEIEHHDLDDIIARLVADPTLDQLQLRRLKKKKLLLKDLIARLRDRLIPDIIA